jgi:hypothetical protein
MYTTGIIDTVLSKYHMMKYIYDREWAALFTSFVRLVGESFFLVNFLCWKLCRQPSGGQNISICLFSLLKVRPKSQLYRVILQFQLWTRYSLPKHRVGKNVCLQKENKMYRKLLKLIPLHYFFEYRKTRTN